MSNQSTELQKPDSTDSLTIKERIKERIQEGLWKAIVDEPIKKGVWIMAGILVAALVYFWLNPSWWAGLALGFGLALLLIFVVFVLLVVRYYRNPITETAKISETTDFSKLLQETNEEKVIRLLKAEHQTEIENLKAKQQEKLDKLQTTHEGELRQRDAILDSIDFLRGIEKEQRENIEQYVYLNRIEFHCSDTKNTIPYIMFSLEIFNASVFRIALEEIPSGNILFKGEPLLEQKKIHESPPFIEPNEPKKVIIKQRLSDLEVQAIEKARKEFKEGRTLDAPEFQFENLNIIIKGSKYFPQVEWRKLIIENTLKVDLQHYLIEL